MSEHGSDHPSMLLPPPVYPVAALLAAIAAERAGLAFLDVPARLNLQVVIGILVIAAALGITVSGAMEFRRAGTNINPYLPAMRVVDTGPYRFTRNPMYVGFILLLLGISLCLSLEWGVILTPAVWLALDRLVVAREEAYLATKFGSTYRALLARTRRWL